MKKHELAESRKAEECIGQLLAFPLAMAGTDISIWIENVSDEPAIFAAAILGDIELRLETTMV